MRVNISKSKFFARLAEQVEYLGYWITRQGIQSIHYKIKMNAILNIKAPKTRKEEPSMPVYW
jgi:RNA binding exosome subunit